MNRVVLPVTNPIKIMSKIELLKHEMYPNNEFVLRKHSLTKIQMNIGCRNHY